MNNLEYRTIENSLKRLWLLPSEISIFLLWVEHGALSISQLATLWNMWRITVHEIAWRLIKKWLFLETRTWRKRLVYANQVDAIAWLVDEKKQEITYMEKAAKKATSLLRSLQTQSENFPKTRFYKWKEGIQRMLNEIKKDVEDLSIMSDGQHFYELIDNNFLEKTLNLRQKKNLKVKLMFPAWFEYFTYTQWTYQQELEIKALPDHESLKGWVTLRWKKVALHCYEWTFITTTILENTKVADMHRYLFDMVWKQGKKY